MSLSLGLRAVGVLLASLLLSSCSRTMDAFFVNPCDQSLDITTYYSSRPSADAVRKTAQLEPAGVTKVNGAFSDATGFVWFVDIAGADAGVTVEEENWVHSTVVIPASVCDDL